MGHKVLCGLGNWVEPVQNLLQRLDRARHVRRAQVYLIVGANNVRQELQSMRLWVSNHQHGNCDTCSPVDIKLSEVATEVVRGLELRSAECLKQ